MIFVREGNSSDLYLHSFPTRRSSDLKAYLSAVENAFGCEVDYAQLIKIYGNVPEYGEVRYSPAVCMGSRKGVISGKPDRKSTRLNSSHANTSYAVFCLKKKKTEKVKS